MPLTVAIVGRPNVGKSTLFNRLVGRRVALVDDTPGLTRDRREGQARLGDLAFTAIDTAGLEDADAGSLEGRMRAQTEQALEDADVALFLVDARAGITALDEHFARWLRAKGKPIVLVANKSEGRAGDAGALDSYRLGLGEPLVVSAEHGQGLGALHDALAPLAREHDGGGRAAGDEEEQGEEGEAARPLALAIVGRPNVGKSTLVNRLLGEERVLTDARAGITRDAVHVPWSYRGRAIALVDTAGLRRRARVSEKLEALAVNDALKALRFAEVVVLLLDAEMMLEKQDLTIARTTLEEGRALVIAVNKWDRVDDRAMALKRLEDRLEFSLPQGRGVAVVTLSALTGRGVGKLMPAVLKAHARWNRRLPTAALNRWLAQVEDRHPPPLAAGRSVRLRYVTQAKTRPPTFVVFANRPEAIAEAYVRYLVNDLRETFDLPGVPLRLHLRKGDNPYAREG